ncbi:MAG: RidA family protein, partial [Actinobacteria bacterium]
MPARASARSAAWKRRRKRSRFGSTHHGVRRMPTGDLSARPREFRFAPLDTGPMQVRCSEVADVTEGEPMITDRIDPPGLLKIPEMVNVSVATGTRMIHVSGQTSVGTDGKIIGSTHLEQGRNADRNLLVALEAAGATLADVAKITTYVVD